MRVNKFVLDNNIWVSYFITKKENILLEIIETYELAIFSCDELIRELRDVLGRTHIREYGIKCIGSFESSS
jgi:predicted nucleic acid-binding protein